MPSNPIETEVVDDMTWKDSLKVGAFFVALIILFGAILFMVPNISSENNGNKIVDQKLVTYEEVWICVETERENGNTSLSECVPNPEAIKSIEVVIDE